MRWVTVTVVAPPRSPDTGAPEDSRSPEALIEEARQHARRRRRRLGAAFGAALMLGLGTYAGVPGRGTDPEPDEVSPVREKIVFGAAPRDAGLTILIGSSAATVPGRDVVASIQEIGPRPKTIWSCAGEVWCGQPVSHDWAPDGQRLALTLDEVGGMSDYPPGLHVIDVVSGRDVQIPALTSGTTLGGDRWPAHRRKIQERLGCWPPTDLDWSPGGTRIAYRCSSAWGGGDAINVIRLGAPGFITVPIPGPGFWPSWSADGTRIAYATKLRPGPRSAVYHGVYVMNADGSDLHRVTPVTSTVWYGRQPGRPSWRPLAASRR